MKLFSTIIAAMDTTTIIGILVLGLLLVLLFVYPSFVKRKQQKSITELYRSVDVGDRIKTVGGIIGTVLEINEISPLENEIVLETGTGDNKTTMVFDMQAVYQNLTKMAQRAAMQEAALAAAKEAESEQAESEQAETEEAESGQTESKQPEADKLEEK